MSDDPYDTARQAQKLAAKRLRRRQRRQHATPAVAGCAGLMAVSSTQLQGHAAEQLAARFLEARGLHVLAANLHCRAGEIDLVAWDVGTLVFVEVRQRTHNAYGGAAASVNRRKQSRLIRTAQYFLPRIVRQTGVPRTPVCRFDVIAVDGDQLTWVRNAFRLDAA